MRHNSGTFHHGHSRWHRLPFALLFFALVAVAYSPAVRAATYDFRWCFKYEIYTDDSDQIVYYSKDWETPITEDQYLGTGGWPETSVIARGVKIRVENIYWPYGYYEDYWADSSGCFEFDATRTTGFQATVYGMTKDTAGNVARIHTGGVNDRGWPGSDIYEQLAITGVPDTTQTFEVGAGDERFTTIALAAFSLYRYHDGISNKTFHIAFDDSTYCYSAHSATVGSSAYLRIASCANTNDTRRKFIVAHEMGHAVARLYSGQAASPSSTLWTGDVDSACGYGYDPIFGNKYTINSVEWNSIGFREGFADFYSAKVWNNKDGNGAFTWYGGSAWSWSLERWDAFGGDNSAGGRLLNLCCDGYLDTCDDSDSNRTGTTGDWLRFFWDWYTLVSSGCSQPSKLKMLQLYDVTLDETRQSNTYYEKMHDAAWDSSFGLTSCQKERFDTYASHNGICKSGVDCG